MQNHFAQVDEGHVIQGEPLSVRRRFNCAPLGKQWRIWREVTECNVQLGIEPDGESPQNKENNLWVEWSKPLCNGDGRSEDFSWGDQFFIFFFKNINKIIKKYN
jgi:hypothetical protein